ncbi:hypothetical protein [Streptomyces sp. NPDC006510]|uniref:hypothetical protein n=1 Tax=Streptomyces sp. NPDC006510 TaxID=3155600 RepID=UPI0033BDBC34
MLALSPDNTLDHGLRDTILDGLRNPPPGTWSTVSNSCQGSIQCSLLYVRTMSSMPRHSTMCGRGVCV